jgi:hypothetical protein
MRRVALQKLTDVSEVLTASIVRAMIAMMMEASERRDLPCAEVENALCSDDATVCTKLKAVFILTEIYIYRRFRETQAYCLHLQG